MSLLPSRKASRTIS